MTCIEFQSLSLKDKIIKIGELVHLFQADTSYFERFNQMIELARIEGKLDEVTILPDTFTDQMEIENEQTAPQLN